MDSIKKEFDATKKLYDAGSHALDTICLTVSTCLRKLAALPQQPYGKCSGKDYSIYESERNKSRPFLPALFNDDPVTFERDWKELIVSAQPAEHKFLLPAARANATIYTAIMAFSVCYDLWKPGSRKTPGTFFEVILGSLLSLILKDATRTKFINLPIPPSSVDLVTSSLSEAAVMPEDQLVLTEDQEVEVDEPGKVATDIVFNFKNDFGIVIPAKITTRERIVQPFAHQRILDCAIGIGRYTSLLTCVSETQRADKTKSVNEICVPGTIALFQEYLAKLGGIYYLDPPQRYLQLSEKVIKVGSVGDLVTGGLAAIIKKQQEGPAVAS